MTVARLTLTIRILATAESFGSLSLHLHISNRAISNIIESVKYWEIVKYFVLLYLRFPSTEEKWLSIAEKFESHWQYPNAVGVVDGENIVIHKPNRGGLYYYNY